MRPLYFFFLVLLWLSVQEVCTLKGFLFSTPCRWYFIFFRRKIKKNTAVKVKMLAINWPAEEQNAKGMLEAKTAGVKNLLN